MEELPPQRSAAIRGDDARYPRVHPPLPDACVAPGLPPHPLLWPADQPNPRQQHRAYPRAPRSSTHPSRRHQGCHHKARRAESARASLPMLRRPHAHHRDLLCWATAKAPPDPTSAEDPHRHLMMTISEPSPKSPSPVSSLLSRPRLSSLRCCVHHATAAPVCTDTPARGSEEASPPSCIVILTALLTLAAELSCGPPAVKSP